MSNRNHHFRLIVRLGFFAGLTGMLVFALHPSPLDAAPLGNDKVQHIIAFLVLSGLGRLGWSSEGWGILFGLVALGGAIELLQGIPIIARDSSLLDWLADSAGVLTGMLAATAVIRLGLTWIDSKGLIGCANECRITSASELYSRHRAKHVSISLQ